MMSLVQPRLHKTGRELVRGIVLHAHSPGRLKQEYFKAFSIVIKQINNEGTKMQLNRQNNAVVTYEINFTRSACATQ